MKLTDLLESLGNVICYYPAIARLVGVKENIFLSHVFFWTGKSHDGWIYRTTDELYNETGLSPREQHLVRHNLSSVGILEIKQGRNRIFIRVSPEKLNEFWALKSPIQYPPTPEVEKRREERRNGIPQTNSRNYVSGGQDLRNVIPTSNYSTEEEQIERKTSLFPSSNNQSGDTGKSRKRKPVFVKPTVEEMIEYGSEISLPEIEAKKAHNYYETRGWTVGKANSPMADWKSALRNWKIGWKERGGLKQRTVVEG
jgi:hypothetical protein